MSETFDAAEERARLAAADLASAARDVIRWQTMKPEDVRDDVDAIALSRRWARSPQRLEDAYADLDFASRAESEVVAVSTSRRAIASRWVVEGDEGELIDRLIAIAAQCERRAMALRS
jgi:hypothetical protein